MGGSPASAPLCMRGVGEHRGCLSQHQRGTQDYQPCIRRSARHRSLSILGDPVRRESRYVQLAPRGRVPPADLDHAKRSSGHLWAAWVLRVVVWQNLLTAEKSPTTQPSCGVRPQRQNHHCDQPHLAPSRRRIGVVARQVGRGITRRMPHRPFSVNGRRLSP